MIYLSPVVPHVRASGSAWGPLVPPVWPVGWIDLRPPFGADVGVLYVPGQRLRLDGLEPLASDYRARLYPGMRRRLQELLDVDVPELPLNMLLYVLLRHRAREGKRLTPGHYWHPHYRIYLGGAREDGTRRPILVRRARIPAFVDPTYSESWPTADTLWDGTGQDLDWTVLAGNWDVTASATVQLNSTGQGQIQCRCDEVAGSASQEARCAMTIGARGAVLRQMGVFCRHETNATQRNHYRQDFDRGTTDPDETQLNRFDNGTPTLLVRKNVDYGAGPHTVGCRCDGSTIFGYIGAIPFGPATDTGYDGSTHRQSGIDSNISSGAAVTDCVWGAFVFEDLSYHLVDALTAGDKAEL